MYKPSIDDMLAGKQSRYSLVIGVARRAREIANGDDPLTETDEKSPVTIAAEEIAEGKISIAGEEKIEEQGE